MPPARVAETIASAVTAATFGVVVGVAPFVTTRLPFVPSSAAARRRVHRVLLRLRRQRQRRQQQRDGAREKGSSASTSSWSSSAAAARGASPPRPQFIDLGSGSGQLVRDAARLGYEAVGVESNPWLYLYARARCASVRRARIIRGDLKRVELSRASVVYCYGIPELMPLLAEKAARELAPGAVFLSNAFDLNSNGGGLLELVDKQSDVRVYRKRACAADGNARRVR